MSETEPEVKPMLSQNDRPGAARELTADAKPVSAPEFSQSLSRYSPPGHVQIGSGCDSD